MIVAVVIALIPGPCLLDRPVSGPVVASFSPDGPYGGHWGVDLAAPEGTPVRAAADGVVTFSGEVATRISVTIHHGGFVRTAYSYLERAAVETGETVVRGQVIGESGMDHGVPAVHFSLRVGDLYLDPAGASCGRLLPGPGVRLVPAA